MERSVGVFRISLELIQAGERLVAEVLFLSPRHIRNNIFLFGIVDSHILVP